MKNRIASLLLVFALLLSLCGNAVARDNRIVIQSGGAERFTDVPTSHWAYSYINKVVGSGLFNGMTPTTFAPSNAMTRAQFVIVMSRMEGLNVERVETVTKFPDVPSNYWAAGAVAWATEAGIVGGFGDGTFKPTSPITRGQFAALIHRYIVSKRYVNLHVVDPEPAQFTDAASVSSAFTNDVEYARVHGLLTGYSDGTVRASNPITRAAIAAILARFLDLVQESGYTPLLDGPVIDGGDSGDSVETPTNYDAIKMNVLAGTHGTTAIASVLRNGVQVASDDVQAGDRVTITHKPESGYVASVRVRDANGKVVTVHKTDANTSWFDMPAAMPVTVTVTYSKESSGGGGGGGSGNSGSNNNNNFSNAPFYFLNLSATETTNGTIQFVRGSVKNLDTLEGVNLENNITNSWFQQNNSAFTFSVVLTPASGYTFSSDDPVVTDGNKTYDAFDAKIIDDSIALIYNVSNTTPADTTHTNALNITVTTTFIEKGTTPTDTWQLTANVDGGYVAISENVSDLTVDSVNQIAKTTVTSAEVATTQKLYVAFTRDADSEGEPILTPKLTKNTANSVSDSLWVYEVTSDVTSVSAVFKASNPVGATYGITVNATADGDPEDLPTPKAQVGGVDVTVAARGDTVTVVAPEIAGYGSGYHVKEVTGVDANGNPVSMNPSAPSNETADANGETFTFTMPGSAVTITVVYEANADEDLSYAFNVSFTGTGTGSLTLNVAGKDYPLSNAADGQQTVDLDLTADNVTIPSTKGKYVKLYGDMAWADTTTFALPIYLAGTPVASADSKYDGVTEDNLSLAQSSKDAPRQLVPEQLLAGGTGSLTVEFNKIQSYGYKLTVIGKGSVSGTFGNDSVDLSNDTTMPVTKTSGAIVMDSAPTLKLSATAATGWDFDSVEITYPNGDTLTDASALRSGFTVPAGITEVVVSFYDTAAGCVAFTVTGNGLGNVTVKGENGSIKAGTMPTDPDTARANLGSVREVSPTNAENTYYARVGTIITILPKSNILTKVDVDGRSVDELATAGFSYTLPNKDGTIVITVETGEKDSYAVALQAPYNGASEPLTLGDIHTKTKGITQEDLKTILYSLNDAYRADTTSTEHDDTNPSSATSDFIKGASALDNNYGSTGSRLTQAISYYLTSAKNADNETGREALERTLNEIVEDEVKNNLSNIIKNQKDDMLSGTKRDSLLSSIDTALDTNLTPSGTTYNVTISDAASIASVIQKMREKDSSLSTNVSDYVITANVQPILTDSQLTGLSADKAASVKSVKSQLKSFIVDYLDNTMQIADVSAKEAAAHVQVIDANKGTVRIYVTAALNAQPTVSSSFADIYKDKLVTWLLSTLTVTYQGNPISIDADIATDVFSMASVNFANAAQENSLKNDIVSKLGTVDTEVAKNWNSALDGVIDADGTVYVSMKSVFDKAMLDKVVEGVPDDGVNSALETIVEKITTKVESVKPGTNTESAFMNIYRDFVVFNKGQENLLTLKTRSGKTDSVVLGKIVENSDAMFNAYSSYPGDSAKSARGDSLVLYLNFDAILADKKVDNDTAYEKLIDLVVALRDGLATDIRLNAENSTDAAKKGQTAESVVSGLIRNQIDRAGVQLSAKKWGKDIGFGGERALTAMEKQELCDLSAKLLMTPLDETLDNAWKDFEKNGYQSVSLAVKVDATKRIGLKQLVESLNQQLNRSGQLDLTAGFKVEEILK